MQQVIFKKGKICAYMFRNLVCMLEERVVLLKRLIFNIKSVLKNLVSVKARLSFSINLIAFGIMAFVVLWTYKPVVLQQESIAKQWSSEIKQIEADPVYPPQNGLMIGGMFLLTNDSGSETAAPNGGQGVNS